MLTPTRDRVLTFAAIAALTLATIASSDSSQQEWADASLASIHPGVQTVSGGQCTSNFVFTDDDGVYLGQAAHCSGTGGQTDTNGCTTGSMPLGSAVEIDGAQQAGELVYSSWIAMQDVGEADADTCSYNDFALIKIHPDDVANVNPSIPVFGGPTALTDTVATGETVSSYGNSSLRFGLMPLSPKTGVSLGQAGSGWTHTVYSVSPGIPGDSGSGFLDEQGNAFGVLSTLAVFPNPGSNGVSDLSRALQYARSHGWPQMQLALGTEAFSSLR